MYVAVFDVNAFTAFFSPPFEASLPQIVGHDQYVKALAYSWVTAAKRRFTKGLTFDANWTWSHSIDDASDPGATLNEANLPQDVRNTGAEKASSSFDHRHRAVVSLVYQIPTVSKIQWAEAVLGQWQAGGNFT